MQTRARTRGSRDMRYNRQLRSNFTSDYKISVLYNMISNSRPFENLIGGSIQRFEKKKKNRAFKVQTNPRVIKFHLFVREQMT